MKFYRLFLSLTILIVLFIPHSLTYALTAYHPIHELVNESDIVFIGTVTRSLTVTDNTGVPDESEIEWKKSKEGEMYGILTGRNREGGDLYCIRVDKVLYGKEKIKQAIFSKSRIGAINRNLKRNRKRNPVKLFAFQKRRRGVSLPLEAAAYYENESQLFFLKVSKFPKNLPDTLKILDRKRSPNGSGSELQRLTKADLTKKFYFEACFKDQQATWLLTEEKSKKKRPTVEAFCELVQRQQRLRELRNSEDALLAENAHAALRTIWQAKRAAREQAKLESRKSKSEK